MYDQLLYNLTQEQNTFSILEGVKGVQFGFQNFLKIWDLTNSGKKMTIEILFSIFKVKFGQAAPSKSVKLKSHLLPEFSSDCKIFNCKMILRKLS